MKYSSYFWVYG